MDIAVFVNNWLRPEVKSLIQQYTLCSPIKKELETVMKKRECLSYDWCIMHQYCFDTSSARRFSTLYIEDSSKEHPSDKWTDLLKETPNGKVCPGVWTIKYQD